MNKVMKIKAKRLGGDMGGYCVCPKCKEVVGYDNYCSKCGTKLKEK